MKWRQTDKKYIKQAPRHLLKNALTSILSTGIFKI